MLEIFTQAVQDTQEVDKDGPPDPKLKLVHEIHKEYAKYMKTKLG